MYITPIKPSRQKGIKKNTRHRNMICTPIFISFDISTPSHTPPAIISTSFFLFKYVINIPVYGIK